MQTKDRPDEDLRTEAETAEARRRDRLRGWRNCSRCGIEYHSSDGHRCRLPRKLKS